ncbi:hypothetical protein ACFE04_015838 [Oxalis oulophora]
MEEITQRHPSEYRRPIVFVPFPFEGHTNPILQFATALHSKGFTNITVAHSQLKFPHPSNHPDHLTILKLPDGILGEDYSQGFGAFVRKVNEKFTAQLQELLSRMIQDSDELPCVIYDGFMYQTEDVANNLKLPSIVIRCSNAMAFLVYFSFPRLREQGLIPFEDSKLLDPVPELEPLRFKELPIRKSPFMDSSLDLLTTTCNWGSSSAQIFNTIDVLENSPLTQVQQICQIPVYALGPIHKIAPTLSSHGVLKADVSCFEWLDKQESSSVIYVSMGSGVSMNVKDLIEMAWGLANSGQPFLWVVRPGSVEGSKWIELLPEGFKEHVGERGCIIKWAPQKEVLAHHAIGGFWSHCGWNSTLESISEGVPMICRPSHGDQKMNTRSITSVWKVGFEMENELERGEIDRCIKKLMVDKEGHGIRQRAMELKEKIDLSIEKGGSTYNSLNALIELIVSF